MRPLASACFLLLVFPSYSFCAEPVVVRNPDRPLWDATRRIEFQENLRIGGEDDEENIFGQLISIAADTHGRIIVADRNQNVVRRYDTNGELLGVIGRSGEGPGEYGPPNVVSTDAKDNIYIAGQGRVSTFDAAGEFVSEFRDESHDYARSLRVLGDGSILLSEVDEATKTGLQKYVDGKHVASFSEIHKFPDDVAMALLGFRGGYTDVGPDGMIYFTQLVPYEIRKYNPSGELLMRVFRENDFVRPPDVEKINDGFRLTYTCQSCGIFVLPDGRFINVAPAAGEEGSPGTTTFDLFDADGRLLLTQRLPRPFTPQWLDDDGNVYVFDHRASAVVRAKMLIQ